MLLVCLLEHKGQVEVAFDKLPGDLLRQVWLTFYLHPRLFALFCEPLALTGNGPLPGEDSVPLERVTYVYDEAWKVREIELLDLIVTEAEDNVRVRLVHLLLQDFES